MRRTITVACSAFILSLSQVGSGATWHVDASVPAPGDGTSWEKAFRTIEWAIDVAFDGDIVIVAQGTYVENIKFNGTDIALTSTDPHSEQINPPSLQAHPEGD